MPSFAYDEARDPPSPIVLLRISSPGSDNRVQLQMLADTGADITVVPARLAERLLAAIGVIRLQGLGAEPAPATLYRAAVEIDGVVDVLEVVGWGAEAILGRDVLNRWVADLDGPRQTLSLGGRDD